MPSDWAVRIALRTQQVIAFESGVTNSADPLAGSYMVETMTSEMENRVTKILDEIDEIGGVIPAIETGYFQKRIADSSYSYEQALVSRDKIVVGVNALRSNEAPAIPILQMDPEGEERQRLRLRALRESRDAERWQATMDDLEQAAREDRNLMPYLIDAVKANATLGEVTNRLRAVYGAHRPLQIV